MTTNGLLLVEGATDRDFIKYLLQNAAWSTSNTMNNIEIKNCKGIDSLLGLLNKTLELRKNQRNSTSQRLGIIIDADYEDDQNGYINRRSQVIELLNEYTTPPTTSEHDFLNGELFSHQDPAIKSVGLWIMPNHHSCGTLETLLLNSITAPNRNKLLSHIEEALEAATEMDDLDDIRFKDTHRDKTLFNTWLSWQRLPSNYNQRKTSLITHAFNAEWLDPHHETSQILALQTWLERVFA